MALSSIKKTLAFDANKEAKSYVKKVTDMTGKKGICAVTLTEYKLLVDIVGTIVGPVEHFKSDIESAFNSDGVMDALGTVSEILDIAGSGLGKINPQIDENTIKALNVFNSSCLDFSFLLPQSMVKFLSKTRDAMLNRVISSVNEYDMFELPEEITNGFDSVLSSLKEKALSTCFGDSINSILNPLQTYKKFIKTTSLMDKIKKLQKFEKCLTNKQTCDVDKKELYYPGTKMYNSQYFLKALAVNIKGEVQLKRINSSFASLEGKTYKTLSKLDAALKNPIKN